MRVSFFNRLPFTKPIILGLCVWAAGSLGLAASMHRYLESVEAQERAIIDASTVAAARLAESALQRMLEAVRSVEELLAMRQRFLDQNAPRGANEVEDRLRSIVRTGRFGAPQISVVSLAGQVIWGTEPGVIGLDVADREDIRTQLQSPQTGGLFLSRPMLARETDTWTIFVSFPMFDEAGIFIAIGVVALDAVALSSSLGDDGTLPGRVIVIRRLSDGAIMARSRAAQENLGRALSPHHPVLAAARHAPAGNLIYRSERDGRLIFVSYRVPAAVDVSVAAAFDENVLMANFHRLRIAVLGGLGIAIVLGLMLVFYWAQRWQFRKNLEQAAHVDPLTGLRNRRSFEAKMESTLRKARDSQEQLAVLLVDIDHFKRINDTYGHAVGDQVLQGVARTLSAQLREKDLVCRWGGEEILIVLRDCPVASASVRAEQLRQAIQTIFEDRNGSMPPVTASIGVSGIASENDLGEAIRRADLALYQAKHAGRNRVAFAPYTDGRDVAIGSTGVVCAG